MNYYDLDKQVKDAHDNSNKVSRNYRPELLDDGQRRGKGFFARLFGSLGGLFVKRRNQDHDHSNPLRQVDDPSNA